MLLLCLYGYSMALAASDQRWSGLHRSLSENSLPPDAMKHKSCMRPLKPVLMPPPSLPTPAQQPPQEPPGTTPQRPVTAPAPPEKTPATSAPPVQPKRSSAAVKDKIGRRRHGRHDGKHKSRKLKPSSVVQRSPPPVRRTVTRIKAGFQYIRRRSAQLGRTPIMGPVVKIGRFLGSPTQRASPTREDAPHGGRKSTEALTQGTVPTSTSAGREQFFKTPYLDLHAKFETAPDAVARDDRAEASVAAERMTRGIATHAPVRELVKESKPSESVGRAQLSKTRDLNLKATFEDVQPAFLVGAQRGVTPATPTKWQKQQVIRHEQIQEPTRRTSEPGQLARQGAMARQEQARGQKSDEEELKPYVQIRAVFEPLLREKHPENVASAATARGGPVQTGTMRLRSPYVHGIVAQVERQLQQQMQSPHFVNITAGIHRPGAPEQRRAGFYCLHPPPSGARMAVGSLPPLPPLSDEAHGSVCVAPTRATTCRPQPEVMLPPHLPQARTAGTARQETLGRSTEDRDGQHKLAPRLDPRLKALQSVLIKANFTPRVPDKTVPAAQDGPAVLPSTGGPFRGIADNSPPSSPPPPSVPPPPPPLPPPPSNPRRRIEPFFFQFAGSVGTDDVPTCVIRGGITQSLPRLVDKKPQQPQHSASAVYLGKPADELPKSVEGLPEDANDLPKAPQELPKIPPELTPTLQTQAGADSPEAPPAPSVTPANFSKHEKIWRKHR
ncbi:serine/arginine repetitive matrix protein 1-like [Dermacentor silvarum]|uniref:serine/arginine repetitive matrix protein 1-like n=1 Tax=Dermacentor silvarum TaxID=543639 RepID=UPI002100BE1C|nr:serine/arginine repetitive matrix protein 1-like [Dermacentor silvarum]